MKRILRMCAFCAVLLLLCMPLRALAIDLDGNVAPMEWYDIPPTELFREASLCGIASATARYVLQPAKSRVILGFTVIAPGVAPESPVGAAFFLAEQEIARWQQGLEPSVDTANYELFGLSYLQPNSGNGGHTYEIVLGYKSEAALAALSSLSVQLFDPQGNPSRLVSCPVAAPEPVTTTTKPPTTEKTTTTKLTTTKATTAKATTTDKPTTTLPVYTKATLSQASAPPADNKTGAVPPQTTPANQPQMTQPGTSRTEIIYYTQVYTNPPATLATEQPLFQAGTPGAAEATLPQSLPTLAMPETQPSRPAAPNAAMLFSSGGVLAVLGTALGVHWLRLRKKPIEQPPTQEENQ